MQWNRRAESGVFDGRGGLVKRILVAGGAGFLGSHLCEKLLARGDHVICLDNFTTGRECNVVPFLRNQGRFELLRHDICLPLDVRVEEIYNLACPASPPHYQRDPVQTLKTSVLGSLHLLQIARRCGAKILQASTSEVYGDPQEHPQTEKYWGHVNPIGVRSCYDEGKRCAETLFFDFHRSYGLPIRIARIFNTYGPRMHPDDGRVVSTFIVQALRKSPLTIYGDGSQTRSFCYVSDLVEGLILLMDGPQSVMGPINLGNPCEMRVDDLARRILEMTGSTAPIVYRPLPADDPRQRRPNIQQALDQLGWKPRVPLEEGLLETIGFFKTLLREEHGRRPRALL